MDETRDESLTKHVTSGIHVFACAKHIQSILFVLPLIVLRGNRLAYFWCCAGLGTNRLACINGPYKRYVFPAARWCITNL